MHWGVAAGHLTFRQEAARSPARYRHAARTASLVVALPVLSRFDAATIRCSSLHVVRDLPSSLLHRVLPVRRGGHFELHTQQDFAAANLAAQPGSRGHAMRSARQPRTTLELAVPYKLAGNLWRPPAVGMRHEACPRVDAGRRVDHDTHYTRGNPSTGRLREATVDGKVLDVSRRPVTVNQARKRVHETSRQAQQRSIGK